MSARQLVIGSMLFVFSFMVAADEELPDMDFIEYLGIWEDSDEDWLLFSEPLKAENEERSDPAPEGKESTEKDDES